MNWKISLDKYLTEPPDDGFDSWCEDVVNNISETFYNQNEDWIDEYAGLCNSWLNKLFRKPIETKQAALIIERAFKFYKINN